MTQNLERMKREFPRFHQVNSRRSVERLCIKDRKKALSLTADVEHKPITLGKPVGEIYHFWRIGDDLTEKENATE
jgi:hypothetical protein